MFAGLSSAYNFAFLFGKGAGQDAERGLYADFLDEAALLLERPALGEAAGLFRASAEAWRQLPAALLPSDVAPFGEARELMWRKHTAFLEQGNAALEEIQTINGRLEAIADAMDSDFPLSQPEVVAHREHLAQQILDIHDAERAAVQALQAAME